MNVLEEEVFRGLSRWKKDSNTCLLLPYSYGSRRLLQPRNFLQFLDCECNCIEESSSSSISGSSSLSSTSFSASSASSSPSSTDCTTYCTVACGSDVCNPGAFELVVPSVTEDSNNPGCGNCGNYSGTFVLEFVSESPGGCSYQTLGGPFQGCQLGSGECTGQELENFIWIMHYSSGLGLWTLESRGTGNVALYLLDDPDNINPCTVDPAFGPAMIWNLFTDGSCCDFPAQVSMEPAL